MQTLRGSRCSSFCRTNVCQAARPQRLAQSSGTHIVAMARPKASDWRSLSPEQIQEEIAKSKRALYDWRVAKATRQSFKPSDKHYHEVKVAQLLTVLRDQGVKSGVTKREARRQERQRQVKEMNMLHVPFDSLPKFNSLYLGKQPSKQNQVAVSQ